MKQFKAAFFDIDGTLVSFQTHRVPESARLALQQLRANGVKVFISSGRHINSINNLDGLLFDGYVVINGTLAFMAKGDAAEPRTVANAANREVIYRHSIPQSDIDSWLDFIAHQPRSTVFVYEDGLTCNFVDDTMQQIFDLLNFPSPVIGPLEPLRHETIYQIITVMPDSQEAQVMTHLPNCKTTRWHPLFTDIIERHASKADGMQAVLDHFGWTSADIIAFGDGGNDLEMLRMAGTSVAMGNADEIVRQSATFVTESVDNDGVMLALNHFGLI